MFSLTSSPLSSIPLRSTMREKAGDAKRGNPYGWNSPRGARAVNRSRYLMRALGLEVLSCSVQSLLGSHSEERKVVIEQSRWVAICRSAVHMLPVAASITLFYFNIHGYYIGGSLSGTLAISDSVKLNMLQFAAKIHELLIVASLAEVVFYLMRNQLIFGQGLPLGLLGSGLNFMSPRFFWFATSSLSRTMS